MDHTLPDERRHGNGLSPKLSIRLDNCQGKIGMRRVRVAITREMEATMAFSVRTVAH